MDPNKAKLRGDRLVRSLLVGHTIDLLIAGTLVLALLGTGYFEVREYRDYREKVSSRALRADLFQAAALASRLSSAFLDLGFVASSVSGESRPSRHPSSSMQKAFRIFLALHPALVDLEIFDPRTGKSLWTNRFPSASLSGPGRRGAYATPLSSNPSFLVGKSRLSARIGGRILPLAILLPLTKGHPPLGVRTYLRVEALRPPSLASPFSFFLRDSRNGDMMLLSRGERPDSPLLPSPGSRVRTPVSGYPFTLEASWPSSLVREGWMEEASRRWMVEEGGLFLMLLMAGGIRILVRRQERQGEELSELSAFDEAIFDSAGAIGMVIDENGEIQRLNRAAREFMGVTLSEVRGRPYYWERFLPDWMRPGIRDFVLQMKDETRPVHHQNPWITPSGSLREFEWTSTVLRDREGRFLSLVTLGLDVTERMTLERELEEKNLRLGRLLAFDALRGRVAEAVSRATKEGEILPEFCRLSLEVPEIRMAWVGRPDEEGIFRPIASSGETDYLEGLIISVDERRPEGRGPMGQSWRSGAPVYSESFSENPAMAPWRDRGARSGFLASASLPVRRSGAVWAVLTVYFDRKKPFETEICNLLEAIADNLSLALDRLDLAERERKATALKETLLANTSAGIDLVRYPERVVVEVNRGFLEILGYREAAEIVGHHVQDLYFVEDESFRRMGEAAAEALATGSSRLRDLRIRRADGTEGFVDLSGAKIREADHETIVWTIVDVTERHRLARELSRLSDSNLLLAQINQAIVEAATEDSLLRAICDLSVRYGKLRLAWIGRPEEEKVVNVYASSGETAFLEGLEISVDPTKNGPVGEVWRTGVPSFNIDLERTFAGTSLAEKAFRHGLKSAAVLPVMKEGAIWGILALYREEAGGFFPPLTEVFSELARDISRGLDRLESLRREREMATLENVLLENTLAGILFQEQRVIRYANDRMRQMLGYESSGEMVGRSTRMLYADTGEYERVGFAYTLLPSRESVEIPDVRMVTRSGQPVMVDLSLARIPGEPSKVVVTVYDVTDRHAQTERLRLLSAYNTLLAHAGEALSSSSDEPSLLKNLCDLAVRDGEMAVSAIGRAEDGKGVAWLGASGKTGFLEGLPFFAGSGDPGAPDLLSRAFSGRRPVFGFAEDPVMGPWRDRAREFGIKAMGALPIFRKGEVWGVLLVGHGTQRVFEDPVLEGLLNELARTISHGLDRLDLLARQNLLSSAVAAVGEGVVITGPDSRVIFANDGFAAITGYSASEMVGENCRILQGEATDPATVGEIRRALREGRPFHGQILNYRKDKTPFWNLLSISPVRNSSGEIVEFVGNQRDITSLIDLTKRLEYDSRHDRLTGLPNRRALDLEFDKVLARSRRYGWPFAVAILDLDGFKPVNDRYGHEAGDRLLRLTGERILGTLRKTDFLARQGGDEFVLLLENVGLQEELGDLLERIDRQARIPVLLEGGEEVSVGVSIGVALSSSDPEAPENPEILLRRADQALYESKNHKSDRSRSWVVHGETVPLARTLPQRLLSERRVEVHYQPVLDNRTGRIAGIEALARLRDPGGRILMPEEILLHYGADDLFELSRQVLERSLSDLAGLLAIDPSLWLSVNVDPRSVSEGCFDCLGRMLDGASIPPSRLTLEILEGQEFGETVVALDLLRRLRNLGVSLAMDDVGSAYSSLLRLKDLPVDKVKLDQGFVRTLDSRPRDLHFVEAIKELCHRMGLSLVVEGVETDGIMDAMRMLGVDFLQGFAISRPLPLRALTSFLQEFHPEEAVHPKSLLGLYAQSVRIHGMQMDILLQSPDFLDRASLEDGHSCPLQKMFGSLDLPADGRIDRLHSRYHRALGALYRQVRDQETRLRELDLGPARTAMEALTESILAEDRRRRKE